MEKILWDDEGKEDEKFKVLVKKFEEKYVSFVVWWGENLCLISMLDFLEIVVLWSCVKCNVWCYVFLVFWIVVLKCVVFFFFLIGF